MALIEEKESEEYAEEDEEENERDKESSEMNSTALHSNSFFFPTSSSTQSRWVGVGGGGEASAEAEEERAELVVEREHMFDKVVTPSDVGKLNRLVIPKQHAEKYFPLDTTSATGEKGLLLNFEDAAGKQWRFRYSYWNSSQSYVMTKGWSRFVKDKKLDAGDVVSFERGAGEAHRHRFFIDWKRRSGLQHSHYLNSHHRSVPWGRLFFPPIPTYTAYAAAAAVYNLHPPTPPPPPVLVYESVPLINHRAAAAAGKRVRLFGVNLDCPEQQQSQQYHYGYSTGATAHLPPVLQLQLYSAGGEAAPSSSAGEVPRKQKQSLSLDLGI